MTCIGKLQGVLWLKAFWKSSEGMCLTSTAGFMTTSLCKSFKELYFDMYIYISNNHNYNIYIYCARSSRNYSAIKFEVYTQDLHPDSNRYFPQGFQNINMNDFHTRTKQRRESMGQPLRYKHIVDNTIANWRVLPCASCRCITVTILNDHTVGNVTITPVN